MKNKFDIYDKTYISYSISNTSIFLEIYLKNFRLISILRIVRVSQINFSNFKVMTL